MNAIIIRLVAPMIFAVTLLCGCNRPYHYITIHWWNEANDPENRARLILHKEGGDVPQDVSSPAEMLSILSANGWEYVSATSEKNSRDYLFRRHGTKSESWTLQTYRANAAMH